MLTSTSEVLTPAELSIASVLSRTPLQRRLDPAALGHAEVGALADHLGSGARAPVMRIASLARSPTASSVSLAART